MSHSSRYRDGHAAPDLKAQLDKLGRRLARDEPISDDDYRLLHLAAGMYQAELDAVEERLRHLGFQATTRVKTTGTLVDKLRRTNLSLSSIQDFAGARIVIDGTRQDQDQAVNRIIDAFQDCPRTALGLPRESTAGSEHDALGRFLNVVRALGGTQ